MKTRTITAVILVAIALPVLIFSQYIVYPIALSLLSLGAIFELYRVIGVDRRWLVSVPAYVISVSLPLISYFIPGEMRIVYLLSVAGVVFAYLLYLMCISVFSRGAVAFSKIGEAFVSFTYAVISLTSLSTLRYCDEGMFTVMLVFFAAWGSDVMAYFVGSMFGKHKLIPEISPKKTVEGSIGGVVFAVVLCMAYGFVVSLISDAEVNYISLALSGFVLSIISQVGDLVASLIKRENGVKDYGNLLPGHGGVMDRFDSVFAVATPLLIICLVFPPFK
ncbi:MAG: phosphatidate cytidylyltransferase [Clostridia bacterium]|nr:phosphatidate cytidylyltransferase [Clostridia bacterium]